MRTEENGGGFAKGKLYPGFGGRLFHETPGWVREDAIFHIRIRCAPSGPSLTEPKIADSLLASVRFYHERHRWCAYLFLLMPDHCHALLSFGRDMAMSRIIGDWKHYQTKRLALHWQSRYFDHRLRDHLSEFDAKAAYIRANPVVKGLSASPEDWPWQWSSDDLRRT